MFYDILASQPLVIFQVLLEHISGNINLIEIKLNNLTQFQLKPR